MSERYQPSFLSNAPAFSGDSQEIDWSSMMHPDDREAIDAMEKLPGFSTVMKWVLSGVVEKVMFGKNIGNTLRLGPDQLPEYYQLLVDVCKTLGITEIPQFYMEMNPVPNAYTCGEQKAFVHVTSGLVESFTPEDIRIVLAHECGHILFRHVRYSMLAQTLLLGLGSALGMAATVASFGLSTAFEQCVYRWMRMSEYSADRVSALYAGSAKKATSVIMHLAGGPESILKNVNYKAYYEQTLEYEKTFSTKDWEGILQNLTLWSKTHPYNASRGVEIGRFASTTAFKTTAQRLGTYCCGECGAKMRTLNICMNGHIN